MIAEPDSTLSPDQASGSVARPSRGKGPETTSAAADPGQLNSPQHQPTRHSKPASSARPDSTTGPLTSGKENKSTDPASQPSKRRLYKNNLPVGESSTDHVSASGSESESTLPPSTDATPTGTPRSPARASPERAPSPEPLEIRDEAILAPQHPHSQSRLHLRHSSTPLSTALSATAPAITHRLLLATNWRSRRCAKRSRNSSEPSSKPSSSWRTLDSSTSPLNASGIGPTSKTADLRRTTPPFGSKPPSTPPKSPLGPPRSTNFRPTC